MSTSSRILVAALAAATSAWVVAPAAAAPIASPMMLQRAVDPSVETVRYYGHHHGGAGLGLGIAGALIGGAILGAATQPYGYYGYPGYPGYPGDANHKNLTQAQPEQISLPGT
jgi:hypothetical protein